MVDALLDPAQGLDPEFALDVATGRQLWNYDIEWAPEVARVVGDLHAEQRRLERLAPAEREVAALAAALTTVSSVIGPIMPPSIPLVLYALATKMLVSYW